jgi:hypothetical protein
MIVENTNYEVIIMFYFNMNRKKRYEEAKEIQELFVKQIQTITISR